MRTVHTLGVIQHFCCKIILNRYIIFLTSFNHEHNTDENKARRTTPMTDSATLTKGLDLAIQIMQWVEGKEHLLAMGKVFLCTLFLGGP